MDTGSKRRGAARLALYGAPIALIAPLAFLLFFAYAERGAPRRRLYAGLALSIGLLAWLVF